MKRLALLIILSLLVAACNRQPELTMYRKQATLMFSEVTVTVSAHSSSEAEAAIGAAFAEIERLEGLLSFWTDDSEIALINRNAGKAPVRVSPETLGVINAALVISEWTGGSFDATIGPVIRQWDFKAQGMPDEAGLVDALGKVDYHAMRLDTEAGTAFLARKDMSFDTGGIAKGYAADAVVAKLKEAGIPAALVAVAGDIRAYGTRPDGEPWMVGVRDPRGEGPEDLMATLPLMNSAISTSGDYERFFFLDGRRYHHILDPETGYPARGTISVTVIAPNATLADGLSTGIFVMGPEAGLQVLEEHGLEGIIVSSKGKTYVTDGIRDILNWGQTPFKP